MPIEITLGFPVDSTFLSEITYEGILYLLKLGLATTIKQKTIKVDEDAFDVALKKLNGNNINRIRIVMSGNDNFNKLPNLFGIKEKSKKTFRDLLHVLSINSGSLYGLRDKVELNLWEKGKKIYFGSGAEKDRLTAQLTKIDRYTGFSSLETPYTSIQLTMYLSKEVALLTLLGIYSSFITTVRLENETSHYFVFFSPSETQRLLLQNGGTVRNLLELKDSIKERFSEILRAKVNELLPIETSINLSLIEKMNERKVESISLLLFKVNSEGQTYKIYEKIPLTVHREPTFLKILENLARKDPKKIIEKLNEIFKPNNLVFRALTQPNRVDHENVLKAILSLHRFVVAGDPQGWFMFLRELSDASIKSTEKEEKSYNSILSGIV